MVLRTVQFGGMHDHHGVQPLLGRRVPLLHYAANRGPVFSGQATTIYQREFSTSALLGSDQSQSTVVPLSLHCLRRGRVNDCRPVGRTGEDRRVGGFRWGPFVFKRLASRLRLHMTKYDGAVAVLLRGEWRCTSCVAVRLESAAVECKTLV